MFKMNLTPQQDKFKLDKDVTYLNTAYMAPLLKESERIGIEALSKKCTPYKYQLSDFFEPVENIKKLFAELIDAPDPKQIAIIPSASYGIANVANNVCLNPGDEIIVIGEQFPSNIYSWKTIAKKNNAQIKVITAPHSKNRGEAWNKNILETINPNTALIAMPHVHWADGTLFDLKTIREKSSQNNALLIIDGTQSVGALPFSVNDIKPDALICAGYKWLMGPYALGLAYYGEYFNNGVPIEENWINRLDSDNFAELVNYQDKYQEGAQRYSVGEMSNFNLLPMLTSSIKQLLEWEPKNIQNYCYNITEKAVIELRGLGCFIEEDSFRSKHLFGVKLPENIDIEKLKNEFEKNKIFVSFRGEYIRIAPHVFNTSADLDKLVNCFKTIV
jgi:selenocysteine lyase/cysteine desulfurase